MFEENNAVILSKYCLQPGTNHFPSDFTTNSGLFSTESQLPELYLKSTQQFDKNLCFFNLKLTPQLKENIYPKQQYKIPKEVTAPKILKQIEKISLDDLFGKVKITTIDVFAEDFNLENIEESILRQKIKDIIGNNKIVPYERKQMINRQWYLIGGTAFGPYADQEIHMFLKNYYTTPMVHNAKFMIWEKLNDIFYRPEVCYEELSKVFHQPIVENTAMKDKEALLNDFQAMKMNINQANTGNAHMRVPYRRMTKDVIDTNFHPKNSFVNQYGFGMTPQQQMNNGKMIQFQNQFMQTGMRNFNRQKSYQQHHHMNMTLPMKGKAMEKTSQKEIVINPFEEEEDGEVDTDLKLNAPNIIQQEDENSKVIDINSLFA